MTGCPSTTRRALLAGLAAGMAVAPGVFLAAQADAAAGGPRWGLLVDTNGCRADCEKCVTACAETHGWAKPGRSNPEQATRWIRKIDVRNAETGAEKSFPVMCQHCAKPPCVDVCPTGASMKRHDGIVLVDRHRCIGCRYCMMACPYGARSFVHEDIEGQLPGTPRGKGTVGSCNLCVRRIDAGGRPACVDACPTGAMIFGDLNDPASEITRRLATLSTTALRPDLRLTTGVRYQGI